MEATTLSPRTTGRVPLSVAALGLAGMYTATIWVAIAIAMHLVRDDLDPCCSTTADYATGDLEWLMQAGFAIVGFGWMGVGIALRRALNGVAGARVLRTLLLVVGTGLVFAGVFPVGDAMHTAGEVAAWAGLVAFGVAAAITFTRTPTWRRLATPQVILAIAVLALGVAAMVWEAQVGDGFGWWDRALAILVMPAWLAHLGWTLNRAASRAPQQPEPPGSVWPTVGAIDD